MQELGGQRGEGAYFRENTVLPVGTINFTVCQEVSTIQGRKQNEWVQLNIVTLPHSYTHCAPNSFSPNVRDMCI